MPSLITGASGFLGGHLAQILVGRGEAVTILARPTSDLRHLAGLPIRVVQGDLHAPDPLREAVRDATYIYHCAAASTDWAPWPQFYSSNVTGTETLLAVARASAPKLQRFLHVSTTDVYGYPLSPGPETDPTRDVGLSYNRTKILAEQAVWRASSDLPVTVVRPATIYGPRGTAFVTDIAKLLRARQMAHIDGGDRTGGFLYVDNAAHAMIAAATHPATLNEAYNLSDGTGVTWRQYVDALADGLGAPKPWINLPFPLAMAIARTLEAPHTYLKLPGRPLLTRHATLLLGRDQEFSITKAQEHFNFQPAVSFPEGIARSVAWVREAQPR